MEEQVDGRCSVVYFCTSAQDDVCETYNVKNRPKESVGSKLPWWCERMLSNVRILLDEDQGAFEEVFVASTSQKCVDQLELYSGSMPTVLLVEIQSSSTTTRRGSRDLRADSDANAWTMLEALATDVQGAHYQKPILPFAIIAARSPDDLPASIDADTSARCLNAGALEVLQSPIDHGSINRLVSHVKQQTRPPAKLLGSAMAQNLVDSIRNVHPATKPCYRPDETVPLDRRKFIEAAVREWDFQASDYDWDELTCAAMFMLEHMLRDPALSSYGISREDLMAFLLATRRQYKHERQVHYHNWRHAVDVTQSLYRFLIAIQLCPPEDPHKASISKTAVEKLLTPLDGLILLISAVGHDVGHPGVNNAFLVACNHPLAQLYNDKSVLENYHCAAYSQLLRRHWHTLDTIPSFRTTLISTILATDMQRHFEFMGNLNQFNERVQDPATDFDEWSEKDRDHARELLMALLIKAADISNVARPFNVSASWATILLNEFARQGELEDELDIPTCLFGGPPKVGDMLAAAQSQQGFISLFGYPLFSGIADVIPSMSFTVDCLSNNKKVWEQRAEEEKAKREANGSDERPHFSSVGKNEVAEAKDRAHKSEPFVMPSLHGRSPSEPLQRDAIPEHDGSMGEHELKQQLADSIGMADARNLHSSKTMHGVSSRRSSKDVALDHMQQMSGGYSSNSWVPPLSSSRRGSGASFQYQQGYGGSRRASKDESLTTILVTHAANEGRKSSPGIPGSATRNDSPTGPQQDGAKRQNSSRSQKQPVSASNTSSRSQGVNEGTSAMVDSTQPSSLATTEEESAPLAPRPSIPATEDPFLVPSNWPDSVDGAHRASAPVALAPSPSPHSKTLTGNPDTSSDGPTKTDSPQLSSTTSNQSETTETGGTRTTEQKHKEPVIRESRSHSRLRGLKFWKKKKETTSSSPEVVQ